MGDSQQEKTMSDSQQDREKGPYLPWSPQETKTLINLLLDGLVYDWRDPNGVFSKFTVERKILPIVNQQHGGAKTHKHYLNRIKTLKGKHLSGVELLRCSSGFGWDPNTKRFTASDEVWSNYIKAHPSYKKIRDETFEEFEDLKMIFEDNIASGGNAIGLGDGTDARTCRITRKRTNSIEDVSIDVEEDHETPSSVLCSSSRNSLEKLPLRKKHGSITNNIDEPTSQSEDAEEVHTEINSLTTIIQKLFNLIQERETRQQREAEQREAEKRNNVWEAIKEVPNLEENVCYDAVKVIHQLGIKEVFVSMSTDERYAWIKRNVIEY